MCTVLLPSGVSPIAINKCIISYQSYQYKPSDKAYHETIKDFDEANDVCNFISISPHTDIIYGILY
jgi:hypothetical protein